MLKYNIINGLKLVTCAEYMSVIGTEVAFPDPFTLSFLCGILTLYSPVVTIYTTCFNTLKLCILPTQCIYVFPMVLTINSDCFPRQH
jgi:hypothetical protein